MPAVNLDELEHAAIIVDDGDGETKALVARDTGMIHLLNDEYMDEEAPLPADVEGDDRYVVVPPASTLGIGDQLVFRFAAAHLAGDQPAVRALFDVDDADGFERLLEERGASDAWERFRTEETHAALRRWCKENGLQAQDEI
jgi:hypothetical protein